MQGEMDYAGSFSCKDKRAMVVGGNGLIGREVCRGLRAAGAQVWTADLEPAVPGSEAVAMDVTDDISVNRAMDEVVERAGGLDIVVNCAYPRTADWGASIEDVSAESWTKNLDMQLGGSFFVARAAAQRMKDTGGSVISFASIYGMVGPSWEVYDGTTMTMPSAYSAIKGGVISLTRLLATYYAGWGIRFNVVSPGGVFDNQIESFVSRYEALTPMGRMAQPSDVVGAVVFLASDSSSYVTGQNIAVDGGWTAR